MNVFSDTTGRFYGTEDEFAAAETGGYVVVALLQTGVTRYTKAFGPVATKAEATRLAARVRYRLRRTDGLVVHGVSVTYLLKDF